MSLLSFIVLLIIAGVCGMIGQAITGYSHRGCLASIALGFIGALIGHILQEKLGLPEPLPIRVGEATFPVIWSIIGATIFVAIIGFLTRARPQQ
ncbi:MAG: GlsB/YeaQ/YmgE family stress response membrane protein [Gemmataceae bacterium]